MIIFISTITYLGVTGLSDSMVPVGEGFSPGKKASDNCKTDCPPAASFLFRRAKDALGQDPILELHLPWNSQLAPAHVQGLAGTLQPGQRLQMKGEIGIFHICVAHKETEGQSHMIY